MSDTYPFARLVLLVAAAGLLALLSNRLVERLVTVALICILFDGGLHLGWPKFRAAAAPIVAVGVLGTFLTTAAAAAFVHWAFGLGWFLALLVATAIAPTDPAVVFSVLG